MKGKIYRVCVQRVLIYGPETWVTKDENLHGMERVEPMYEQWKLETSTSARLVTSENVSRKIQLKQSRGEPDLLPN